VRGYPQIGSSREGRYVWDAAVLGIGSLPPSDIECRFCNAEFRMRISCVLTLKLLLFLDMLLAFATLLAVYPIKLTFVSSLA
jgi:hypothetical protein